MPVFEDRTHLVAVFPDIAIYRTDFNQSVGKQANYAKLVIVMIYILSVL